MIIYNDSYIPVCFFHGSTSPTPTSVNAARESEEDSAVESEEISKPAKKIEL